MKLAVFDLDHTLIDIDSDYHWGKYIVDNGFCDATYQSKNHDYFEQYLSGSIEPLSYCKFVADFLSRNKLEDLYTWRDDYINTQVVHHIRQKGLDAISKHKEQGHCVVISSATNDFIVEGVAEKIGVLPANVIASKLEKNSQGFTGNVTETPNFREGKVINLQKWLNDKNSVQESWGYSDSFNDIPLLEFVDHAFVVNADDKLNAYAQDKNWQILDWQNQ